MDPPWWVQDGCEEGRIKNKKQSTMKPIGSMGLICLSYLHPCMVYLCTYMNGSMYGLFTYMNG